MKIGRLLALCTALLMPIAGAAPAGPDRADTVEAPLPSGAEWSAVVPPNWNGVLLLHSRGYAAEGPAAQYLLYESLHAGIQLPREAAASAAFLELCFGHFKAMWPIARWLLDEVGTAD